jgi:hypothetical protein
MSERRGVTETLFRISAYDADRSLADFVKFVADALSSVPVEYRDTAQFEVESGYDEPSYVHAYYTRPETDEEMAKRLAQHAAYAADRERQERVMLASLKAKYG